MTWRLACQRSRRYHSPGSASEIHRSCRRLPAQSVTSPRFERRLCRRNRLFGGRGSEGGSPPSEVKAAGARLLDLIRDFDARGGWNIGFRTCADWLSWRVGLAPGAARERVRVARALGTLPLLAQALACGLPTLCQVVFSPAPGTTTRRRFES